MNITEEDISPQEFDYPLQDFEISASKHNKRVLGCAKVFGFTLLGFVALSVVASVGVFGDLGQMKLPVVSVEDSGTSASSKKQKHFKHSFVVQEKKSVVTKKIPTINKKIPHIQTPSPKNTDIEATSKKMTNNIKKNGNLLGMDMQQGPARHGSHASAVVAQGPAHHGSHASDIVAQGPARHGSHTRDIVFQGPAHHGSHISAIVPHGAFQPEKTLKAHPKSLPHPASNDAKAKPSTWAKRSKPSLISKRTTPSSAPHTKNLHTPYADTVAAATKAKIMAKKIAQSQPSAKEETKTLAKQARDEVTAAEASKTSVENLQAENGLTHVYGESRKGFAG